MRVWGDSPYTGQKARLAAAAPGAKDFTNAEGYRYRKLTKPYKAYKLFSHSLPPLCCFCLSTQRIGGF